MRRNPSPKQRFIKDYARLIYGPDAKSNALTHKDRTIVKCLFTSLPDHTDLLVQYPAWLEDNWTAIRSDLDNKDFHSDISTPGTYLFASHFLYLYLNICADRRRPKPR
jgi:hypothetical protein